MTRAPTLSDGPCLLRSLAELNWLAVLLAAIAYYALGGLWFSPPVLGPAFGQAIGFVAPDGWSASAEAYYGPLLASFAAAVATGVLARATGAVTVRDGAVLGLVVALGYAVALSGTYAVTPHNARPLPLFLITGSYHLVAIVVVSVIVTVWRDPPWRRRRGV